MIKRTFKEIADDHPMSLNQSSLFADLDWSKGETWEDLLKSPRILIVSEAGAGKTYECQTIARKLEADGEQAFFLELAAIANDGVDNLLSHDESLKFNNWRNAQSGEATFFLDSIDELQLSAHTFSNALKRFDKDIHGQSHRARVVITTRPVRFDEEQVRKLLPVPSSNAENEKSPGLDFAEIVVGQPKRRSLLDLTKNVPKEWRKVALMPLSSNQILEFATDQGVTDPKAMLAELNLRNALKFAKRPQDLIELCLDWRENTTIRKHSEQILTNVRNKLKSIAERDELADLTLDRVFEGASRLALAMATMRRYTLRYSAKIDKHNTEAALDPSVILTDWATDEITTLLERPIFGYASYGRVRFHHRSVLEYLAAYRLNKMLKNGLSFRKLKRLLFVDSRGQVIVKPSLRPIAGWLALENQEIFALLRDCEPDVLINEGDPESLSFSHKKIALNAYVNKHRNGGWRGLRTPDIQIHRLACIGLDDEVSRIWEEGIENREIRQLLLTLIEAGGYLSCANIVYSVVVNSKISITERLVAIYALKSLNDSRLGDIAKEISIKANKDWPLELVEATVITLFPGYLSIEQLIQCLSWIPVSDSTSGDFESQLARIVDYEEFNLQDLIILRDSLLGLLLKSLRWEQQSWPHIESEHKKVTGLLAKVCGYGITYQSNKDWINAIGIVLKVHDQEHRDTQNFKDLYNRVINFSASENECLFWALDEFITSLQPNLSPSDKLYEILYNSDPFSIQEDRDLLWIRSSLGDPSKNINHREMLLKAALSCNGSLDSRALYLLEIAEYVKDSDELTCLIQNEIEGEKKYRESGQSQIRERKQQEMKDKTEKKRSEKIDDWFCFREEILADPDRAFSDSQVNYSVINLWIAMKSVSNDQPNRNGWNRTFLEKHFGKSITDKFRRELMIRWRKESVEHFGISVSNHQNEPQHTKTSWFKEIGSIYAESEDKNWVQSLNMNEVDLALQISEFELNSLPFWVEDISRYYPLAVGSIIGSTLIKEISIVDEVLSYSMLLQKVRQAPSIVAKIFIPMLLQWLNKNNDNYRTEINAPINGQNLRNLIDIVVNHGDSVSYDVIQQIATKRLEAENNIDLKLLWLSALLRTAPEQGVSAIEKMLKDVKPAKESFATNTLNIFETFKYGTVDVGIAGFTPPLLMRLIRLAYIHVKISDDNKLRSSYTPDNRDDAESVRNRMVNVLLEMEGQDAWKVKIELSRDPLCEHFKDRIVAVAKETIAQELDVERFTEEQAISLDKNGEAAPKTNKSMNALMNDRLDDLEELLLSDESPRAMWAKNDQEYMMRRAIAGVLKGNAKGMYTVTMEEVTADEKETDIRLLSTSSDIEAIIELKLADERSVEDLRNTIRDQLVMKYMAKNSSKSGCLLITLSKDKKFINPDGDGYLSFQDLQTLLDAEARQVENELGGAIDLTIRLLDLRPRLGKERKRI